MPRRIEDFRGLTQASRVRLLHAIQSVPGRKLQELAEEADLHVNTAREHLHVLETEGLIVSRPLSTGSRGRPPVVFDPVSTSETNPHADRRTAQAKSTGDLLRRMDPSLDHAQKIGADAQYQLDALYSHLDDAGFEPELDLDGLEFNLQPCTYHELIETHGEMICAVHARLIQDQLDQVGGPLEVENFEPFVTPHQCRVSLGTGEAPCLNAGSMPTVREPISDAGASSDAVPRA